MFLGPMQWFPGQNHNQIGPQVMIVTYLVVISPDMLLSSTVNKMCCMRYENCYHKYFQNWGNLIFTISWYTNKSLLSKISAKSHAPAKVYTIHPASHWLYFNFHSTKRYYWAVQPSESWPHFIQIISMSSKSAGRLQLPKQLHANMQCEISIRLLIS